MKRFWKDESGLASIEFAFLAPIFFALIFAFFETGLMMMKIVTLENSVSNASRLIYTGKAPTKGALETLMCEQNPLIINCESNINIAMETITDFDEGPSSEVECIDSEGTDYAPAVNYNASTGAEIVYLSVCVTTSAIVPGLGMGLALATNDAGRYEIKYATAFMNEPF